MAEMRWVHCGHCDQTLFTDNTTSCDACGRKLDGSLDPASPQALRQMVANKQSTDDRVFTGLSLRETWRTYRLIRLFVGLPACAFIFFLGVVLTIHQPSQLNINDKWTLAGAWPGITFMFVSVVASGLVIWRIRRIWK
jgi:hypothetical protein